MGPHRTVGTLRVPVFAITSFPSHEDPAWNGFLDAVRRESASAPALVLDLRGNGGGDDTTGRAVAKLLYGADPPAI